MASGDDQGVIRVWNPVGVGDPLVLQGHTGTVKSVAFGPASQLVSGGADGTVRVWDWTTGTELLTLRGHADWVNAVAFSPDGKRVASVGRDELVRIWNAESGPVLHTLAARAGELRGVAFSPDGARLAAGGTRFVKLWDVPTGLETLTLAVDEIFTCLEFSSSGRQLAAGTFRGQVLVWDARPPEPKRWAWEEGVRAAKGLLERLVHLADVQAHLRSDRTLDDGLRTAALEFAENQFLHDAEELNASSWETVKAPARPGSAYEGALRQATEACWLEPENGGYRHTLGAALYRNGRYSDALETLTLALKLSGTADADMDAADLAFLALVHHRLGHDRESYVLLARLREWVARPASEADNDDRALLEEAAAVVKQSGNIKR